MKQKAEVLQSFKLNGINNIPATSQTHLNYYIDCIGVTRNEPQLFYLFDSHMVNIVKHVKHTNHTDLIYRVRVFGYGILIW
jgi:hypothetical protein